MKRDYVWVVLICVALVLTFSMKSYAGDRVGFINLQRLVNESKMGEEAREEILKLRKGKEKLIAEKAEEINNLRKLLNTEGAAMEAREKRAKIEDLNRLSKEYKRLVADAKEDILREDRELVAIILQKADDVLKKVAKKGNYGIILKDPKAIGYLDPAVDITDEILKELNRK